MRRSADGPDPPRSRVDIGRLRHVILAGEALSLDPVRAWRKALLNQMGELRVHDQSLAARAIIKRPYIDTSRVGVWGWNGGGSSTLHLMFRAPDVYKMGMSVAAVPDVKNYDTIF